MTYCFRCPTCEYRGTRPQRTDDYGPYVCMNCGDDLVRDYRAEAAGIGQGVRVYDKGVQDARAFHTWAESGGE